MIAIFFNCISSTQLMLINNCHKPNSDKSTQIYRCFFTEPQYLFILFLCITYPRNAPTQPPMICVSCEMLSLLAMPL